MAFDQAGKTMNAGLNTSDLLASYRAKATGPAPVGEGPDVNAV
jgi:hypothetical protein